MSDNERPELKAFRELEKLVRHLGEEMGGFRRRALQAETRLKEISLAVSSSKPSPEKLAALERENRDLRARVKAAQERTRSMVDRVKFLREQQQTPATAR